MSAERVVEYTFHRRPLPPPAIAFASSEGRRLFHEALAEGTMEGWFPRAEQFHTQAEPAYCGLGTLVTVLNALALDPGRTWRGRGGGTARSSSIVAGRSTT